MSLEPQPQSSTLQFPHARRPLLQVAQQDWEAYPKFAPPEAFARFELAQGIYYNNAWENAASAMEMSAIAAKNSALLVHQHLTSMWGMQHQRQAQRQVDGVADA